MSYSFASNLRGALPNASFIGFTGTPIEKTDANTRPAGKMQNDEFGMSNGQKFGLRTSAFARSPALVGDPKRIALIAPDLVAHFEKRVEATGRMTNVECGMLN